MVPWFMCFLPYSMPRLRRKPACCARCFPKTFDLIFSMTAASISREAVHSYASWRLSMNSSTAQHAIGHLVLLKFLQARPLDQLPPVVVLALLELLELDVAPGDRKRGVLAALALQCEHERGVGASGDARGAGDSVEHVCVDHLARVVDDQNREVVRISEGREHAYVVVVSGIGVVAARRAHILQGVDDDEPGVVVALHEVAEMIREAVGDAMRVESEVQALVCRIR